MQEGGQVMTTYEMIRAEGEWALEELGRTSITDKANYNYYQGRVDAIAAVLARLSKEGK
jgi:hypothetical protein